MIDTAAGPISMDSPWVSSQELSPGMGFPQAPHRVDWDGPAVFKTEYTYTNNLS